MATREQVLTPPQAYEQYFGPAIFEPLARILVDHAAPRAGERALDLACGTGIVTRRVAPMVGPAGSMVAIDVNPAMIEVARSQPAPVGPTIDWRQGDATTLDVPDDAVDLVLCQQGLQFFPDRQAAVNEMRRVLVHGGRVVLATWHGLGEHPLYAALLEAEMPYLTAMGLSISRDELAAPFSLGSADELHTLLRRAGFRDVQMVSRSIEARFGDADHFVEHMEFAYAAVVPQFAEDPAAFADFLDTVNRETRDIVDIYRQGDHVVFPMHATITTGIA